MSFIRSSALRASSLARAARPARYIRTAELQPWQRAVQRRTYASGHGPEGDAKSSDVPWYVKLLSDDSGVRERGHAAYILVGIVYSF
jgi:hypothetical protein